MGMPSTSAVPRSCMRDARRGPEPPLRTGCVDLAADVLHAARHLPAGIMCGELRQVADPPDVIPPAIGIRISPPQRAAGDLLADRDRLEDRAVAPAASADVVHRPRAGCPVEAIECLDEIGAVQ